MEEKDIDILVQAYFDSTGKYPKPEEMLDPWMSPQFIEQFSQANLSEMSKYLVHELSIVRWAAKQKCLELIRLSYTKTTEGGGKPEYKAEGGDK